MTTIDNFEEVAARVYRLASYARDDAWKELLKNAAVSLVLREGDADALRFIESLLKLAAERGALQTEEFAGLLAAA